MGVTANDHYCRVVEIRSCDGSHCLCFATLGWIAERGIYGVVKWHELA